MNEQAGGETKEQKFKRLAEPRINNALHKIGLIGNLAGPQYAYTEEDVNKIVSALNGAISEVEEKFRKRVDRNKKKFEL